MRRGAAAAPGFPRGRRGFGGRSPPFAARSRRDAALAPLGEAAQPRAGRRRRGDPLARPRARPAGLVDPQVGLRHRPRGPARRDRAASRLARRIALPRPPALRDLRPRGRIVLPPVRPRRAPPRPHALPRRQLQPHEHARAVRGIPPGGKPSCEHGGRISSLRAPRSRPREARRPRIRAGCRACIGRMSRLRRSGRSGGEISAFSALSA